MLSDGLLFLVVWFGAIDSFFGTQLFPLSCSASGKYSEKPENLNSRYLYDWLLVAIGLLC